MASIFDERLLSKKDLERINALGELYNQTTDEKTKQDIHRLAESIRKSYGYSGGGDGSEYNVTDETAVAMAGASDAYTEALEAAQNAKNEATEILKQKNNEAANERLRQVYIKNMQNKLGVTDNLKSLGVTGGKADSTLAAMDNGYLAVRDDILREKDEKNSELDIKNTQDAYETLVKIGEIESDAANKRAGRLSEFEQQTYDRMMADLKLQLEQDKFDYQKIKDELDRKHQLERDALEYANELKKIYASASLKDDKEVDNTDKELLEERKKAAWKLLEEGVYQDGFDELLGFSEEVLREYSENCLADF